MATTIRYISHRGTNRDVHNNHTSKPNNHHHAKTIPDDHMTTPNNHHQDRMTTSDNYHRTEMDFDDHIPKNHDKQVICTKSDDRTIPSNNHHYTSTKQDDHTATPNDRCHTDPITDESQHNNNNPDDHKATNYYLYHTEIDSSGHPNTKENHNHIERNPDNQTPVNNDSHHTETSHDDHTTTAHDQDQGSPQRNNPNVPLLDNRATFRSKEHFRMPQLFPSVTSMFDEADREIDAWRASNQDLQQEIEQLQRLVRSLTQSAKDIHHECTKPREAALKVDPSVKLRVGNTRAKASLWERQVEEGEVEEQGGDVASRGGSRRTSLSMPKPATILSTNKTTLKISEL